jgi:predicted nucleic acid-binding protein
VIVLDASALIELLLRTGASAEIAARLSRSGETLHAPHLIDVEVAHVLRRLQLGGELTEERGRQALEDLADLDLERYGHTDFLPRAWELRHNATAYDAVYLALAEALRAPLLTLDEKLANSADHRARIELVR